MFFRDENLRSLGQTVQLGHYPGDACTSPQRSTRPFTVVHSNGIHQLNVLFCGCNFTAFHGDRIQQLMRRRLFPATTTDPQTGASFSLLDSVHTLSVQSKLSLYDFYISLETLTDATGVSDVKVCSATLVYRHLSDISQKSRYAEFLRMVRLWRHLHLLKRGGRAHDQTGVKGTSPGELAVLCPACPYPSINLPSGWDKVPKDRA